MDGHSNHHRHHSARSGHDSFQADEIAAQRAWEMWKSSEPDNWDRALDERERIIKHNPKAWSKAMHQIDEEEAKAKAVAPQVVEHQSGAADRHLDKSHKDSQTSAADRLRDEYLAGRPGDRQDADKQRIEPQSEVKLHPGYAPHSKFAPETPASPAYDAAYNTPEPEFYGLDLGIIKAGVKGGSLDLGVNVGVASTELQLGQETRVDAEFMPMGGPLHARAGAGIGFNRDGVHSQVGAGANFFNLVNGDADFGVNAGRHTGVSGDVRGNVWPVHVQAAAGADVSPDGADAYTGANTGIANVFDVRAGGHVNADDNSGVGAGVGLKLGDKTLDFGPSISTDGNSTVRPQVHLDPGNEGDPTFYPTGDRVLDAGQPPKS